MKEQWKNFKGGNWCNRIDVRDFIQNNYKSYEGNEDFLCGTTPKTKKVWDRCSTLLKEELKKHVLDIDVDHMSGIDSFDPGYIDTHYQELMDETNRIIQVVKEYLNC